MPKRISLPVDNGLFSSPDGALSNATVKNLMPYVPEAPGASSPGALVPTPGISVFAAAVDRAPTFVLGGVMYQTRANGADGEIWSISSAGTETLEATLTGDTIDVTVVSTFAYLSFEDKDVIVICEGGGKCVEWSLGGSVATRITDATMVSYEDDAGGVKSVTAGDGYFIFNTLRNVFISKNISEWASTTLEFNPLDFATAEYKPDVTWRVRWFQGQLRVFGEQTMETWANIGGADFPFQRISGATLEKGIASNSSLHIAEIDGSLIWIGKGTNEQNAVWQFSKGELSKLSNSFIEQGLGTPSASRAFVYKGKSYYGIEGDSDYFIDLTSSRIKGYPMWFVWDGLSIADYWVTAYGKTFLNGRYYLDGSVFTETDDITGTNDGDGTSDTTATPERQFTSGYLVDQMHDVYIPRVELQMKVGTGLSAGAAADTAPTVQMEVSDDFGQTWLDFSTRPIGTDGSGRSKVVWNRGCGASPSHRLFRFTTNTAAETVFLNVVIDVEGAVH